MTARLTEHERRRQENIKRNQELLRELGIREAQSGVLSKSTTGSLLDSPKSQTIFSNSRSQSSQGSKRKREALRPHSIEPRRKSARIAKLYSDKRDKTIRLNHKVDRQRNSGDLFLSESESKSFDPDDGLDGATSANNSGSSDHSDDHSSGTTKSQRRKKYNGRMHKTLRRYYRDNEDHPSQRSRFNSDSGERGDDTEDLNSEGGEVNLRYDAYGPDSLAPPPERDVDGILRFSDAPHFMPNVTPEEMFREGSFGGAAFGPHYSIVLKSDLPMDDYLEFPASWFEGLDVTRYLLASDSTTSQSNPDMNSKGHSPSSSSGRDSNSNSSSSGVPGRKKYQLTDHTGINKFGVRAGQSLRDWENNGWVRAQDPRGWAQWYARFYLGRRTRDDERQIKRWNGVCGPKGRFRRRLLGTIARHCESNGDDVMAGWDDPQISPVLRQTLLHWGNELTENDYKMYLKE